MKNRHYTHNAVLSVIAWLQQLSSKIPYSQPPRPPNSVFQIDNAGDQEQAGRV